HIAGAGPWEARQLLAPGSVSNDASVRALELLRTLAQKYFQPGAFGMTHTVSQQSFFLGQTAMIPCGTWLKSEMLGKIPPDFELGCFNVPYTRGTKADPSAVQ